MDSALASWADLKYTNLRRSWNFLVEGEKSKGKNILLLTRPETWVKEKHPDLNLTQGPGLEISPILELSPVSVCRFPPTLVHRIPTFLELSPESDHRNPPTPSYPGKFYPPKKPYISSDPVQFDAASHPRGSHPPGFFLPKKS